MQWPISRNQAVAVAICIAAASASITFLARQQTIAKLEAQLRQAQAERKAAVAKAEAKETELQTIRADSLELSRLREQMKSTSSPPALPTGFYVGTDQPIYVTYGTPDPILRSFIKALMTGNTDPVEKGRAIFEKICAACHQRDGLGKDGVAPPLVGSEWVLASGGERLARILLNGIAGPITVRGRNWNQPMPPWRENLDDDAIAAVLTFIRTDLGTNKASAIKADLISDARKELHPGPENAVELLQIQPQ